ncbi:hypothetical protein AGABI2DRAFT_207677 [Agaricus bisporus var. bisporus H97]|uniref:hypothetical protein n=1 Tax=Agaricus bisporus var. bisporus (strain H97 / ATCC MYA-4626 / FGSC 10389) TaxID=936046 RepID=UPI00029F52DE|nr:hypothetical protein AGABI2DRAFT_207677 [Agaricus bisporus var. bisporus H97]EKV46165.1 hypothetical protein AGABI2DRAFT_207677 [Agaricus bisporus var. bisporus H97]
MSGVTGWHPGERIIQKKLGLTDQVTLSYTMIHGDLPPEHAEFYETCLPFMITTLDESGRPWGSILTGKNGEKRFARTPHYNRLEVKARTWDGDPLGDNLRLFDKVENLMMAGIGVEFETRRRNKFAGVVSKLNQSGYDIDMELLVNQAIGNCPKYINVRELEPRTQRKPTVIHDRRSLLVEDRLPEAMVDFILSCDTVFIGSSYVAAPEDREKYPSHVGMNHRGGLPGFVRVRKDRRTVVLPDFSGNRLMTTLGNIETTPLASLTFVDFDSGDILYITGSAENVTGSAAHDIMPFQGTLTLIHTTGFVFVHDALPVRAKGDTPPGRSPYSPPIRLLAEESSISLFDGDERPEATLSKIKLHDPHIATFTWTASKDLQILPGQAIILDCSPFLGTRKYQHMSPLAPTSVNDDFIRTWTVSSSSSEPTRTFSITLRYKPGGALTSILFNIAQKIAEVRPELLDDATPLNMTMKIAGITGEFILPESLSLPSVPVNRELVWFGGGIGLTPFLSMLEFLQTKRKDEDLRIHFILSTREPNILLPIVFNIYAGNERSNTESKIRITLDVFHSGSDPVNINDLAVPTGITLHQHPKRLEADYIQSIKEDLAKDKKLYVCGPAGYTELVLGELVKAGVRSDEIHKEGFFY